jgi:hypothetical protein
MDKRKYVKTKRVDGVDLSASAFAFVGDAEDPSTWKLPICFRADERRTRNHIKNALARFDAVKIPATARPGVWSLIRGACIALGIDVPHKDFATEPIEKAQAKVEAKAQELSEDKSAATEAEIAEAIAAADLLSEKLLRKLGME